MVEGHFSGVGHYILGVLRGIDEYIEEEKYAGRPVPTVKVIVPYDTVKKFKSFGFKHIGHKTFPLSFKTMGGLWYRGKLPPIDLWCGRGTYIFTRFVDMPLLYSKCATVIYDLSYELYRQYSDERNAIFLSTQVKRSLKTTDKVITISKSAKQEIVDFYKLEPKKVTVIPPATSPAVFYKRSRQEIEKVKRKYKIEGDYIISLSNLEPRKNLEALVQAYCNLPKKYSDDVSLLVVGVNGWKTEKLLDAIIKKVEQGYKIIRPSSFVKDRDMPAIISGAKMLVYPSHYEGFGMPPLEALACGVPVICSDNSSLPEVVGSAAQLVDSNDTSGLAKQIERYLDSWEEISKKAIVEGPEQARMFSWKESAKKLLGVAEELSK